MKKIKIIMAVSLVALAATACGGNKSENVETEAAATSSADEANSESSNHEVIELPDEYESQFFEGIVTGIDGNRLTITYDGTSMTFDTTNAEISEDSPLLRGSDAEVEYAEVDGDVMPAAAVNVLMDIEQQAAAENRDPEIYGTLSLMDINDITIVDDSGVERTFDNQMSRTVSTSDLKSGDTVVITYAGSVLDTEDDSEDEVNDFKQATAIKVVALDAVNSEDAQANYITGSIDSIDADQGLMTLMNDVASFEVTADSSLLSGLEEDDDVKVYYEGALSGISVEATSIEKEEE